MAELFVHTQGNPDLPAIVWIHGSGFSGRMWQPQIEDLAGYFCLVPDLPEHGRSAAIKPFTLQGGVQEIAGLIHEQVPRRRANLVGLSVGAALGLEILRTHPEVVDRAVLSSPTPKLAGALTRLIEWISLPLLRLMGPDQLGAIVTRSMAVPRSYQPLITDDLKTLTAEKLLHVNNAMAEVQIPAGPLPPTLVVVGEKEAVFSKRHVRALSRSVEGVTGRMVKGVGYGWNLEAPALFNETVRAWLAGKKLPSALLPL